MRKFTTWMAGKLIRKINAAAAQQRGPVDELHHEIVGPDIVYHANVRMAQRSHCAHLAIEPLADCSWESFRATSRPMRGSWARYTSPMPPAPMGARIS